MEVAKKYLISGAGSGIGRAIAIQLADAGAHLLLTGRNLEKLEQTIQLMNQPSKHQFFTLDIRDKSSIIEAADQMRNIKLDGIIANAGTGGENQFGKDDRWHEILDTNLTGTYQFVHGFLSLLRNRNSVYGHIVIISSVLARLGVKNYEAYCASKAGLLGLMRSWAVSWAAEHILVNAICPGWVNTEMSAQGMEGIAADLGISKDAFYTIAMKDVPLGKMSEPEEIASFVFYLLNQNSITGQTIDINGGSVMNS